MKISDLIAAVMITGAICLASVPLFGGSDSNPKELRLADQAYEEQIRTILLYPAHGSNQGVLGSTTQLGHFDLRLTFDDLTAITTTQGSSIAITTGQSRIFSTSTFLLPTMNFQSTILNTQ
jgi:hypothetical protein